MSDIFDTDGQDEGNGNEYQPKDKQVTKLPETLLKDVEAFIKGGKVTKINNAQEEANITAMGKSVRAVRIEFEKKGEDYVSPFRDKYKEVLDFVNTRVKALKDIELNISQVTGARIVELREIARLEQIELDKARKQKQIELADAQNARIADEEALREEALAKLADADALFAEMNNIIGEVDAKKNILASLNDTECSDMVKHGADILIIQKEIASLRSLYSKVSAKRNALIAESNTANTVADIAIEEAKEIEVVIQKTAEPAYIPPIQLSDGLTGKTKLVATIKDYRAVLKWIIDNGEWGLIEGAAFRSMVDSAAKKYCSNLADKGAFKMNGAICKEEVSGRF